MIEIIAVVVAGAAVGVFMQLRRQRAMRNRAAAFAQWWHATGSGMHMQQGEDCEAHARRVAAHAWDAGFAQRDGA